MNARQFIDALRAIEDHGDVEPMAKLYAHEARLWNPQLHEPLRGPDGARHFWQEYRKTFESVHSEFQSVVEGDGIASLEWNSTGLLSHDNESIQYRGVSMVEWSEGKITRFAAYFDPNRLAANAHTTASKESATEEEATAERHAVPEDRVLPRMEAPARPADQTDQDRSGRWDGLRGKTNGPCER